jgi:hypothetical protein
MVVQDWKKVDAAEFKAVGIPESSDGKVWGTTLPGDFVPYAAWILKPDGSRERVPLARWPNWEVEHPYNHFTQWFRVERIKHEFPRTTIFAPKVLKDPDPKAFEGAIIWSEHQVTSGEFSITGLFPSAAHEYDPEAGSLKVSLTHGNRHPREGSPFFLENLPRFLDTDGEWTFVPEGRRLYARLPGDIDPASTVFEVAKHQVILDIKNQSNIEVSGLTFVGGNSMELKQAAPENFTSPANFTQMAAIRLNGNTANLTFRNLMFQDTAGCGISNWIRTDDDFTQKILIADSDFNDIDCDGVVMQTTSAEANSPRGELTDIRVLRNSFQNIGMRSSTNQGGRGVHFHDLKVGEIAGNVMDTITAQGINVVGGRGSHMPLIRIQIYGNQVSKALMSKQDFGNIEFWGHGPAYVYNNIASDPIGFNATTNTYVKNEAFYFDHGIKGYLFNNIGWSKEWPEAWGGVLGTTFFKEVRNRFNQAFHNTAYNFRQMQNMEGVSGDQQHYLSNLFIQNSEDVSYFAHWGLDDTAELAYARNVLAGNYKAIYARWRGSTYETLEDFHAHIAGLDNQISTDLPAVFTDESPVIDVEARDFRLTDTSAAIDRGVRVFVPWSLYANVGEWFFRHHPRDPNTVLSYDLYAQEMFEFASYRIDSNIPGNELVGEGFSSQDYEKGILEDWNLGALSFDGKKILRLPQERLLQDIKTQRGKEEVITPGAERRTVRMQDNSFLIETVMRVEQGKSGGTIAGKMGATAGYALQLDSLGRPLVTLKADEKVYAVSGSMPVNDGRWHHVLAEVDRQSGKIVLYVNGIEETGETVGDALDASASLDNEEDFEVGRGFHGALDYLRVSRGTLVDAKTTIEELMSWQFNGPHFRDFAGRAPTGTVRDAGALEHPTVSGLQQINYTPRPPRLVGDLAPFNESEFQEGANRIVKSFNWGSVSLPKEGLPGQRAPIQVVFGVETIDRSGMHLHVELIAVEGANRTGKFAEGKPLPITQGATSPYTTSLTIPERPGLTEVVAVIFVQGRERGDRPISVEVSFPVANESSNP